MTRWALTEQNGQWVPRGRRMRKVLEVHGMRRMTTVVEVARPEQSVAPERKWALAPTLKWRARRRRFCCEI